MQKVFLVKFLTCIACCSVSNVVKAELSYNFTTKEITNGLSKDSERTLANANDEEKYYYNFNGQNDQNGEQTNNEENKIQPTGDKNNEVKLKIGGLAEFQYFYTHQPNEYVSDILPNGLPYSPQILHNSSMINENGSIMNILGRIDVNPEFVRYDNSDGLQEIKKKQVLAVGAFLSQPFYKASKNTDPRLAPKEYIYVKTRFFIFHLGAVNSAASRMRVDAESIASGAGGIYGSWWRYISLPVFNTTGLAGNNLEALNAMSPIYILYPALPNEAGFTSQRALVGQNIHSGLFRDGNIIANNILYGTNAQGYPTQGAYSNKISVYLKRVKGFSVGISYSPTTANTGFITRGLNQNTNVFANVSGGEVRNYTSVGIDYKKQFEKYGLGIAISATYEHGQPTDVKYLHNQNGTYTSIAVSGSPYYKRHDLNAFNIGLKVVYKNYSIAYSYGYWGKSLLNKYYVQENGMFQIANQGSNSYYHTAGIGANYGPVRLGITYMHSNFAGYKLDVWSIGTDFKMMSLKYLRVQPYFEYTGYFFHTKDIHLKAGDNITYKASSSKGYVLTAGIRIVF